ncbi:tellurite resistance/C4-dicarboxylate transporter family protein [Nitrosospira sp. NpAV]|uniref:tellurite resistance/C4-dicarboxylate transporter family protein n=1 Tax=Nitrosospira sp. NpAV TaxID=58133 RepID=UPI0005A1A6B1|nr:tellurite resistance/C4-dicarboxylate transporter family protein [Nitrosospira sp. NpAV]KIO49757.1 C4-dicarboxylate transporter [Nitrosospira sp. NpAV]
MQQFVSVITNGIKDFHPAYFAMVMATGIVSIAFEGMACPHIAKILFLLNLVFYSILCGILAARILLFRSNVMADLRTFPRVWLFLTFVVGTNTIGAQLIVFRQDTGLASLLWLVALISWIICIYFILSDFIRMPRKRMWETVSGATLLIIVSTVSVALLWVRLLDAAAIQVTYAYLAAWMLWISGFILYLFVIPLIIYRLFFRILEPKDWEAPYWICMGAPAIITLTGSEFVMCMPAVAGEDIREITLRIAIFAWIIGTSWIPYQLFMDIRQFITINIAGPTPLWIKTFPWSRLAFGRRHYFYDPPSWSRVFPIGMYTACTLSLAKVTGSGSLEIIPQYWGWFALLIWSLTLVGTFRAVISLKPPLR